MKLPVKLPKGPARTGVAALKSRGINAYKAYKCCQNGTLRYRQAVNGLADFVQEAFETRPKTALVTLPRGIPVGEQVFRCVISETEPMMIGVVDGFQTEVGLPNTQPELELVTSYLRAISTSDQRKDNKGCEKCVRKGMWGQKKHRKRGTWKGRKETNKMMIRVPHK